ncbi:MAG: hypothetical protein WBH10_03670 [Allopontixanthobacter sediminis]
MIFDVCTKNRLLNTFLMLGPCGIENPYRVNLSEDYNLDVERLAMSARVDPSEIRSRRYDPMPSGHVSFFGLGVKPKAIEKRRRRFSPVAINQGVLHHPATHELAQIPFSTLGWDMLQLNCGRCASTIAQGWTRGHGTARCDQCASWLWRAPPIMVPEAWQDTLRLLAGIVSPIKGEMDVVRRHLPKSIRNAPRQILYDLIMGITIAITKTDDPVERTLALSRACEAILLWPNGLERLIASGVDMSNGDVRITRNYMVLKEVSADAAIAGSTVNDRSESEGEERITEYKPSFAIGKVSVKHATVYAAVRETGFSKELLEYGWKNHDLTQLESAWGNKRMMAFDIEEVRAKAPYIRSPEAMSGCAILMGIPHYGVEQLIASGGMTVDAPCSLHDIRDVYQISGNRLLQKVLDVCSEEPNDGIRLHEALQFISGRKKPYCALIASILTGQLAISRIRGSVSGSLGKSFQIAKRDIAQLTMLDEMPVIQDVKRIAYWTRRDAAEIANSSLTNYSPVQELRRYPGGAPFNHCEGPSKSYKVTDVIDLIERGVVTSDVAQRANMGPESCCAFLKKAGVPLVSRKFWDRKKAEMALELSS